MKASVLQRLYRLLFGDDIFISYSRKDGYDYALQLSLELKDYDVFIDQMGSLPGKEIPPSVRRRLRNASVLVIVGTPAAAQSPAVEEEIRLFLQTQRAIVPISVDGALEASPFFDSAIFGLAIAEEHRQAMQEGQPSTSVLDRIRQAFQYTRRRTVLRRLLWGTLALVILSVGGVGIGSYLSLRAAEAEVRKKEDEVQQAQQRLDRANEQIGQVQADIQASRDSLDRLDEQLSSTQATLTQTEAQLESSNRSLQASERIRQRELGNIATLISTDRGRERDALDMGLRAVSGDILAEPEPAAMRGLQNAWNAYQVYRPVMEEVEQLSWIEQTSYFAAVRHSQEVVVKDINELTEIASYHLPVGVNKIRFSENGHFLAGQVQESGDIRIWRTETGVAVATIPGMPGQNFELSPTGRHLAIYPLQPGGQQLEIYRLPDGKRLTAMQIKDVRQVLFSPVTQTFVTRTPDSVMVWTMPTGKKQTAWALPESEILTARLVDEGRVLATGHKSSEAYLWSLRDGRQTAFTGGHDTREYFQIPLPVAAGDASGEFFRSPGGNFLLVQNQGITDIDLTMAQDGYRLATAGNDRKAVLWNYRTNQLAQVSETHKHQLTLSRFSPDGRFLATAAKDGSVVVTDAWRGRPLDVFEGESGQVSFTRLDAYAVQSLHFLSGDRLLILRGDEAYIWSLFENTAERTFVQEGGIIAGAAFFNHEQKLVTTDWEGHLKLWDSQTGRVLAQQHPPEKNLGLPDIWEHEYQEEPNLFDKWNSERRMRDPWDLLPLDGLGNPLPPGEGERPNEVELATTLLSPGDRYVFAHTWEGRGHIYEVMQDEIHYRATIQPSTNRLINGALFLNEGKHLLTWSYHMPYCLLWESATGARIDSFPLDFFGVAELFAGQAITLVEEQPDGVYLIRSAESNRLLWRGTLPYRLQSKPQTIWYRYRQDTYYMDFDYQAIRIRHQNGAEVGIIKGEDYPAQGYFQEVAVSPDGRWLVVVQSGQLLLWDMRYRRVQQVISEAGLNTLDLAFSPDSKYLLTAGEDRLVRMYDLHEGWLVTAFRAHPARTEELFMHPQGKAFLTVGEEGVARLFPLPTPAYIQAVARQAVLGQEK